ncbi:hypothetical protein NUACC21_51180 [Scytonema sp. NUACC21]
MHTIAAILSKVLRQSIVVLGLMLLISLSGLFFFTQQPSYAVTAASRQLTPDEKIDRAYEYSGAAGIREEDRQQAYEKAVEDADKPNTVQKTYERNLKAYKQENPSPNLVKQAVEQAKELVEQTTGK